LKTLTITTLTLVLGLSILGCGSGDAGEDDFKINVRFDKTVDVSPSGRVRLKDADVGHVSEQRTEDDQSILVLAITDPDARDEIAEGVVARPTEGGDIVLDPARVTANAKSLASDAWIPGEAASAWPSSERLEPTLMVGGAVLLAFVLLGRIFSWIFRTGTVVVSLILGIVAALLLYPQVNGPLLKLTARLTDPLDIVHQADGRWVAGMACGMGVFLAANLVLGLMLPRRRKDGEPE
jgi:hypothetical protein